MQGVGVVAVLYQFVGNLLRLFAGTAEDDTVYVRIEIGDTFQGEVFVLCPYHIIDVADVLVSFVFVPDYDFFRVLHVLLRNVGNLLRHGGGEEQHIPVFRHFGQNGVDTVGEPHVQHFISFVHDDVFHQTEVDRLAVHQVEQTSRGGNYYVYAAFQRLYLAFDAGASVNGKDFQIVDILGIIVQVVSNLQAKFPCRAKYKCLRLVCRDIYLLQDRKTKGCGFPSSRLRQCNYVVIISQ